LRQKVYGVRIAALAVLATAALWAHHSPSAEFDMSKRITLSGTLTQVDWVNPHIKVAMEVKGEGGKIENWGFESNPPAWFRRVGVSRADLAKAIGQTVKVEGVRAKDGTLYGYLQKIILPDGTTLELVNPGASQEETK
jgi:hypothetical protein